MRRMTRMAGIVLTAVMLLAGTQVQAQTAGPIRLIVDASEAPQKILHVKMAIPVTPGALTLYYPEWIPGEHGPTGPITSFAGLRGHGGG